MKTYYRIMTLLFLIGLLNITIPRPEGGPVQGDIKQTCK